MFRTSRVLHFRQQWKKTHEKLDKGGSVAVHETNLLLNVSVAVHETYLLLNVSVVVEGTYLLLNISVVVRKMHLLNVLLQYILTVFNYFF